MENSQQWLPIETAPRDGTVFLACDRKNACSYLCRWDNYNDPQQRMYPSWAAPDPNTIMGLGSITCFTSGKLQPEWWQPLPKPPKGE